MNRNIWLMAIGIIVVLILVNNTVSYFLTKNTLEASLQDELHALAKQIEISVEQSRQGAERFEDQLGREFRLASIATQFALDPDVEKVTNDQLVELSEKLDIQHITLLKRTEDDIVLYKSSDSTQLNQSTKSWDPWHNVFHQLFDQHNVSVEWLGQTLPNFWSGPFEVSSTDVQSIYKWGYYYDGTTNYIVDPYIHYESLDEYNKITGVDRLIDNLVADSESLLEIAAINPLTFPNGIQTENVGGDMQDHRVQRAFIYGDYTIESDKDVAAVRQAYHSKETVTLKDKINGVTIMKLFIPVFVKDKGISITDENGQPMGSYVLSVVSDYSVIQERLDQQFLNIGLIIILFTLFSLIVAIIAMRYYKQSLTKCSKA